MAKNEILFTPVGIADRVYLDRPDQYDKASMQLVITPKEAEALAAQLQPLLDANVEKQKGLTGKKVKANPLPIYQIEDQENEEYPTQNIGMYGVKFSKNFMIVPKNGSPSYENKTLLVDSKMEPMDGVSVWNGSKVAVKFEVYAYDAVQGAAGIKLQPVALQVIELVTGGGADASGFDVVEGGFNKEDLPETKGYDVVETDSEEEPAKANGFL